MGMFKKIAIALLTDLTSLLRNLPLDNFIFQHAATSQKYFLYPIKIEPKKEIKNNSENYKSYGLGQRKSLQKSLFMTYILQNNKFINLLPGNIP